jgi:hypothetical protein
MWSSYSAGAAPVPPSAPSTMMKSGVVPSSTIALQIASSSWRAPTQSLKPVGLPPASSRMCAMKRTSSRGVEKTLCDGGDTHVSPAGTSRALAISCVTFGPGRTPPIPGLAPCDSFNDTNLTWSCAAFSANLCSSNPPSLVRQPK